jgi:hypothetical protein
MSSLDFGAGSGTNTTRNYTLNTFPVLPNSDWAIGFWIRRIVAPGGAAFPPIIGTNNDFNTIEGYVVYDNDSLGQIEFDSRCNAGTLANAVASGLPTAGDSTIYFVLAQRRSNNIEFYLTPKGGTSSLISASPAGTGTSTITATSFFIGRDNFASRWINPLGEVFVYTDRSLTSTQVTTLASGARPNTTTVGGDPLVLLGFRDGPTTVEPNLGTGGATYNATVTGSGFTTGPDFFDLLTITAQPGNANVVNGATATFSVAAKAGNGALTYQWQDDSSGSFANVSGGSGATTANYTTAATTSSFQRRNYRCIVSDAVGSVTSSSVQLTLSWHDVYLYSMPEDADPDDVRLRDPTAFAAPSLDVTVAETVTFTDSQSAAGSVFNSDRAETVTLTDSQNASTTRAGDVAETVTLTDSQDASTTRAGTVAETVTLTDSQSSQLDASAARAETVTLTDSQNASTDRVGTVAETVTLTDSQNAATDRAGTVAETVTLTDAQTATTDRAGTVAETVTLTDSQDASVTPGASEQVTDTVTFTDAQTAQLDAVAARAETVTFTDAQTSQLDAVAARAETVTFTDAQTAQLDAVAARAETVTFTDSQDATVTPGADNLVAETVTFTDASTSQLDGVARVDEVVTFSDSQFATVTPPAGDGKSAWLRTFLQELYQKEFDAQAAIREASEAARIATQRVKPIPRVSKPIQAEPKPVARTRGAPLNADTPTPVFPALEPLTVPVGELLSGVTPLPDPLRIPAKIEMPVGIGELNEDDVETLLTLAVAFNL